MQPLSTPDVVKQMFTIIWNHHNSGTLSEYWEHHPFLGAGIWFYVYRTKAGLAFLPLRRKFPLVEKAVTYFLPFNITLVKAGMDANFLISHFN